jgi:hypothetical protein
LAVSVRVYRSHHHLFCSGGFPPRRIASWGAWRVLFFFFTPAQPPPHEVRQPLLHPYLIVDYYSSIEKGKLHFRGWKYVLRERYAYIYMYVKCTGRGIYPWGWKVKCKFDSGPHGW